MSRRRQHRSPYRERQALRSVQPPDPARLPWVGEPIGVHHVATGVDLLALDGVGLAVSDPAAMARYLCEHLGMQELARTPGRTLMGAGDRAATVTLIAAEGPREAGALRRVVLRVADVRRAVAALPSETTVEGDLIEMAGFQGPEGIPLGFTLVAGGGIDYDIDHLCLRVGDAEQTRVALAEAGFVPRARALHVADKYVVLAESSGCTQRPLLDHIAVRVASVEAVALGARERGLAVDEPMPDGACRIVLPGAEQIALLFVGQTPRG